MRSPAMADFHIEIAPSSSGVRILRIHGPLTLSTLFEFQNEARKDTSTGILLDLTAVPYMDSAGLGSVLGVFASCQRTGRGFALAGAANRIITLFKVARVDTILPIFATPEAAEQTLAKAAGA
jgi:anti-sigma B factor antagonist